MTAPTAGPYDLLLEIREKVAKEAEQLESEAKALERKASEKRDRARVLRDVHSTVERNA